MIWIVHSNLKHVNINMKRLHTGETHRDVTGLKIIRKREQTKVVVFQVVEARFQTEMHLDEPFLMCVETRIQLTRISIITVIISNFVIESNPVHHQP